MNALNANAKERERLARIKAAVGGEDHDVKIVKLHRGIDCWFWLCPKHLAAKLAGGWSHLETRQMPMQQACDDCKYEKGKLR